MHIDSILFIRIRNMQIRVTNYIEKNGFNLLHQIFDHKSIHNKRFNEIIDEIID